MAVVGQADTQSGPEQAQERIVVGVDGSTASVRALRWALRQADLTGAVVEAVQAWQVDGFGIPPSAMPRDEFVAAAERSLATAIDRASGGRPRVRVEPRVVRGHPASVLLDQAAGAQLLVVGSHGYGGFLGALVGSVSQHCIQHANCPVVVVRGG